MPLRLRASVAGRSPELPASPAPRRRWRRRPRPQPCLRRAGTGNELLLEVTWSQAPDGPALSAAVHEAAAAPRHRAAAAPRHLHKKKGSGTFTAGSCVVGVFWDYAAARYAAGGAGPEPASGFYVAVVADAEFVLLLGDLSRGYVERLHGGIPIAGSRMARRRERFVGCGCWSTRARFLEAGAEHEIGVVVLDGDAEAWVTVDGRKVVQLRRLRWRGGGGAGKEQRGKRRKKKNAAEGSGRRGGIDSVGYG
ncbi:uncharacterized protein LOC120647751 [Panicum virgatum]|uniref:uncharacterized protein LOC120647751 n=1 Tax=Panicum virgatum TaxID=38727 RepID=UPI0019D5294E|nr:uncharacterized protein LOC120647751 [Panicum virgatum]